MGQRYDLNFTYSLKKKDINKTLTVLSYKIKVQKQMLNIFFIQKLFTTLLTEKTTVLLPAKLVKKSNNQIFS